MFSAYTQALNDLDLPEEDIRLLFDLQGAGEALEDLKRMGLSGEEPLGEVKTKAPNSDYHKDASSVAAGQPEVAQGNLKRAARIDELNGHLPGSDWPMVTALKMYNGGRVLVFVMGTFAEMSGDVSRICENIAHDLARTHVSYYNDDAKRTKGMCRLRIQEAWGHTAHRGWAVSSSTAPRTSSSTARRTAAPTVRRCRRTRTTRMTTSTEGGSVDPTHVKYREGSRQRSDERKKKPSQTCGPGPAVVVRGCG